MIYYFEEYRVAHGPDSANKPLVFLGVVAAKGGALAYRFWDKGVLRHWQGIDALATVRGPELLRWHIDRQNDYENIRSDLKTSDDEDLEGFVEREYQRLLKENLQSPVGR